MEFFDAYEELYASLNAYVAKHGEPPTRVLMSPYLYQWLRNLLAEEAKLHGRDLSHTDPRILHTDYGDIQIIIDESLSDWDIIVE